MGVILDIGVVLYRVVLYISSVESSSIDLLAVPYEYE